MLTNHLQIYVVSKYFIEQYTLPGAGQKFVSKKKKKN